MRSVGPDDKILSVDIGGSRIKGMLLDVKAKTSFSLVGIWAVADKALVRQDGANVEIVADLIGKRGRRVFTEPSATHVNQRQNGNPNSIAKSFVHIQQHPISGQ